jgi:hypothetical protein
MGLTGPQLRVLVRGHARAESAAAARSMIAIRAAVWAEGDAFEQALAALSGDSAENRQGWLEGFEE